MIDYDRFWAKAGCLPGMTGEQTEKELRRQLGDVGFDAFMAERTPRPAVTAARIEAWEAERGVRLPEVLRLALSRQDGGYVRGSHFRVLPMDEIGPVEDEAFWEFACFEEEEVPDRRLVFRFAEDEETSGSFYLNFARGPQEEPGVFEHHSDPGDLSKCSASVGKFFERMLRSDDAPSVDWSETTRLPIVAEETIDLTRVYGEDAAKELILVRHGENLVLFTHERTPHEERLTRTLLPLPLEEGMAWVNAYRPHPNPTFSLYLQPRNTDGIVELQSKRTEDGRWKNFKSNGVPVLVNFESTDKARLEALRREVLGAPAAARSQAADERREKLQQTIAGSVFGAGGLSAQEQYAAGMQMFLNLMGQAGVQIPPNLLTPENMPKEAAALHEMLQQRMQTLTEKAKGVLADHPLSPEIQQLLAKAMRAPDDAKRD